MLNRNIWFVFTLLLSGLVLAKGPTLPGCPFSPEHLKSQLGLPFEAGKEESGIIGKACVYRAGEIKLWVDAGPLPAPTAAQWRKMSSPPNTSWQTVPNDPDKAVHEIPPPGVEPSPSLSYERGGWLIKIVVTGVSGKSATEAWNKKLLTLKRFPDKRP